MQNPLRLLSLNIERAKHYHRWLPFVRENNFDVVCLQEVCESDLGMFKAELGMHFVFAPMRRIYRDDNNQEDICGIAIGLLQEGKIDIHYYVEKYDNEKEPDLPQGFLSAPRVLLGITYEKENHVYYVATTHFTRTDDGEITDKQREDANNLLDLLSKKQDFVLCGDMNAPRGKECFSMFAQQYVDHIPAEYTNSIDTSLHRNPNLEFMVDALFATPHYTASNVKLVAGLSDHKGIVAELYKE
ncbi:MAG: endonuclease/exonuclease/phosphatase family protein [Candidatus Pacebacteria bacterium]|nr:endonuclease/exonuclease/phosphatase family protein [Candidatus Paceibacterota bacterium]